MPVPRPDQQPGYWNEFVPPRSRLQWALEFPLDDPKWPRRVVDAVAVDFLRRRVAVDTIKES